MQRAQSELDKQRRQEVKAAIAATDEYGRIVGDLRAGSDGVADRAAKNQQEISRMLENQPAMSDDSLTLHLLHIVKVSVLAFAGALLVATGARGRPRSASGHAEPGAAPDPVGM